MTCVSEPYCLKAEEERDRLRAALQVALAIAYGTGADFSTETIERLRELERLARGY